MREVQKGILGYQTSVWVPDSGSSTGAGRTGLSYTDVALSYMRQGASLPIQAGLAAVTVLGTYSGNASVCAWGEINASLMAGWYEMHLPNAAFVSDASCSSVRFHLRDAGSHTMSDVPFMVLLRNDNPHDVLSTLKSIWLDRVCAATATTNPSIGSFFDKIMNKSSAQTFDQTTDSLEQANDAAFSRLQLTKGVAGNFPFFMAEASTGSAAVSLAGIQGYLSRDGSSFTTFAASITEIGRGWYNQPGNATELNIDQYIFEFQKAGYRMAQFFGWTQKIG